MSQECDCAGTAYGNMGADNCPVIGKVPHNIIVMNRYAADGTLNRIDLTSGTVGADIQAMILTTTVAQNRLFPFPFAENFVITKSETVYETATSGNKYKIKDGIRSFSFELNDKLSSTRMLEQANKFGCTALSYFVVDIEGKIEGYKESAAGTELFPIPMSQSTYNAILMYATDTTVQKIAIDFDQSQYFNDGSIYYLTATDLGYSATTLVGLKSVDTPVVSAITTTSATFTITRPGGSALETTFLKQLLVGNFSIIDLSTGVAIPGGITGFSETSQGVYVLSYTAIVGTPILRMVTTATGYDVPSVEYLDV